MISILTGPTTLIPIFPTAAAAFTVNTASTSQCTEGSPGVIVPTTNGVVGTMWTATTSFTMAAGAERCDFAAFATLTVGPSLQVYSTVLTMNVQTENVRVDNFNFHCDAPGIAPGAYSTVTTTCNDPNLNMNTEVALTGELTICPETGPCFLDIVDDTTDDGFLSVPPATISNISVNGTFPSELTVHADFPGDSDSLGFDAWAALLFWLAAVLFFSYLGWLVALAFAVPGFIASAVPSVASLLDGLGLTFEALIILCLLGFMLEVAANRWSWGGYTSGSRRLRFGA